MSLKNKLTGDIIGLDLGTTRTGVARLNVEVRIAEALDVIMVNSDFITSVVDIVREYGASAVVVGIPRGLDGQDTTQTAWALSKKEEIARAVNVSVFGIDEAGTTRRAEEIVQTGQSIDSVAAGIIIEDFVNEVIAGRIENVTI